MSSEVFLGTYLILYNQNGSQKRPIMTYFCYWIANDFALIMIYLLSIIDRKNSKVFEQKGDLLNFKANIDPMA